MKKTVFIITALILSYFANAQEEWSGCLISMTNPQSNDCKFENDSVSISFRPRDLFWTVKIENKYSNKITCNWDDVLFNIEDKTSGIVFDNTIKLKMNDPKGKSTILTGSVETKEIFPIANWTEYGAEYIFKKRSIKKNGPVSVTILLPISYGNNVVDYTFNFSITSKD